MFHSKNLEMQIKTYLEEHNVARSPAENENKFRAVYNVVVKRIDVPIVPTTDARGVVSTTKSSMPLYRNTASHQLLLDIIVDLESQNKLGYMASAMADFFWLPAILRNGSTIAFELAKKHKLEAIINAPDYEGVPSFIAGVVSPPSYSDLIRCEIICANAKLIRDLHRKYVEPSGSVGLDPAQEMKDVSGILSLYMTEIENFISADDSGAYERQLECVIEYAKFYQNIGLMPLDKMFGRKKMPAIIRFANEIAEWFLNDAQTSAPYFGIRHVYYVLIEKRQTMKQNGETNGPAFIDLTNALVNLHLALENGTPSVKFSEFYNVNIDGDMA
jgi:hypothetical protein